MAKGENYQLAAKLFLPKRMEIVVETMLAVVGSGVTSEDGVDQVSILEGGLRTRLSSVRVHYHKHRGITCFPENKPCCLR